MGKAPRDMSVGLETQARREGFVELGAKTVFDITVESPALEAVLSQRVEGFSGLAASLRKGLLAPPVCSPRDFGRFYRLPNHQRSFCYALRDSIDSDTLYESDV